MEIARTDPREEGLDLLLAILRDADEDEDRVRRTLGRGDCDTYVVREAERSVGVAVVERTTADPEILYIAVDESFRGRGFGRALLDHVKTTVASGERLVVGTGNSSLDNIAFYQRCGFRMDAVKKDHFGYVQPPITEFGIPLRDMIVFVWEAV